MTKWSLAYEILRSIIKPIFRSFYKTIESQGTSNIPNNKPTIFAANHQNALMDPLSILFTSKQQTVFLTRADIFENPLLLKIFTFFKMLPVYRIRDGKEALKNNERIFNASVEILEANMSLALFPEATHGNKRHLKQSKKAVPRIAFQAEMKNNFELDLQIVPVGIYYEDYVHSNNNIFLNYGKPFGISEFKDLFIENEQKGYKALKEKLETSIKELIIHQPDLINYELYEAIRVYNRPYMLNKLKLKANIVSNKFKADQETVTKLKSYFIDQENETSKLSELYNNYNNYCDEKKITNENKTSVSILSIIISSLLFIIGLPVFLFGFINNIIYYILITKFLKKVKDLQFHTSIKFFISIILSLIIYPIHSLVLLLITGEWTWSLIYLISLPLTALFANKYRYSWIEFKNNIKLWAFSNSKEFKAYKELKKELDKELELIMS